MAWRPSFTASSLALLMWSSLLFTPPTALGETPSSPKIWIINTPLLGELNAMMAVARRITTNIELIDPPPAGSTASVSEILSKQFGHYPLNSAEWPALIFHALKKTYEVKFTIQLRKEARHQLRIVNFYDAGKSYNKEFDLIVNPSHLDYIPEAGENIIQPLGVPSQINHESLTAALRDTDNYFPELRDLAPPVFTVMIGGNAKLSVFTEEHAKGLARILKALNKKYGGTFLISTSRRTAAEASNAFFTELNKDTEEIRSINYLWDSQSARNNPYTAMLARADYIITTGDSMSMVADGAVTGKPVFVYAPQGSLEDRHRKFVLELYHAGMIKPLSKTLESWEYKPLDTAGEVAQALRLRFLSQTPFSMKVCASAMAAFTPVEKSF